MHIIWTVLEILAAILVFGLIIFVHEFGHFIVSKWMKVRVNEFSIGMGPALFQKKKGETMYSIRLLPLGGYCALEGETGEGEDPEAFFKQPIWRRFLVLIAGVFMNFLLGFLLVLIALSVCVKPEDGEKVASYSSTRLSSISESSPAFQSGLRKGDRILKINKKTVMTDLDIVMLMQSDEDGCFDILVSREVDGKQKHVQLTAVQFEVKKGDDGEQYLSYDFTVYPIRKTVSTTLLQSVKMEYSYTVMVWRSLVSIVSGEYGINDLSGPVGTTGYIADAVDGAVQSAVTEKSLDGLYALLMIVVLITVNVGLFNILPLPALDGGRVLFLLIELIIRKPVPSKYENLVHTIGFLLLLLLMLVVTYNDIIRLFH